MSRYLRPLVVALAVASPLLAAAGCGGSSSSSSPATTPTTPANKTNAPGGINYDPATTLLKSLGLQICSQQQMPATAIVQENFTGARSFVTAPDCSKKGPRTTIIAATFSTPQAVASGKKAMQKRYPKAAVTTYKTFVIAVQGPNAQQIANEITKKLGGSG
jgi:hypothetical protein